jgi:hypothetical protein
MGARLFDHVHSGQRRVEHRKLFRPACEVHINPLDRALRP